MSVRPFLLSAERGFTLQPQDLAPLLTGGDLVVIGTPNNPTGALVDPDQIIQLAKGHPATLFLVDEAFLDFVEGGRSVALAADNIMTLHSLTKFYAIPGLRLGFGIFPLPIARLLREHLPPWTVNTPEDWDAVIAEGVDAIITDYPADLIAYLKAKKLR